MKLDILAFGAHPDDVELGCGGTIAKEISAGKRIGIVDLTRGELGTRGTPEIRAQEAQKSSDVLGTMIRENLGFKDGFFKNDEAHQLKIITTLRKYRPEIVFCNATTDRHIDHGRGSQLVSDACFLSGLRKINTAVNNEAQEVWRPKVVYHYLQWNDSKPDFVVDISTHLETKLKSVMAYTSQFYNSSATHEPLTPIATKNFAESVRYRAADLGRIIGVDYAEGFTVERYVAVDSIFNLI